MERDGTGTARMVRGWLVGEKLREEEGRILSRPRDFSSNFRRQRIFSKKFASIKWIFERGGVLLFEREEKVIVSIELRGKSKFDNMFIYIIERNFRSKGD